MSLSRDTLFCGWQGWGLCPSPLHRDCTSPRSGNGVKHRRSSWLSGNLCVCKGLCVRAHTVDEQKVPKCVPTYVLLWACLADSSCAGAPTQCICPRWCGPVVWPLEAGEAAGCSHLQHFPQLQCDAITFLLLWSLRHQRSSLAGQIITEDPECS